MTSPVTVTETYALTGIEVSGSVTFTLTAWLTDGVAVTVPAAPITAWIDSAGQISVPLTPTDNLEPSGQTYQVAEVINGVKRPVYYVIVPSASAGQTVTLASLGTAEPASQYANYAPLISPALTGTPTAPTAAPLTDTTQVATTAYSDMAVGVEKTRALAAEALKAPLASPALTGSPTAPTQTAGDVSSKIATDAFVSTAAAAKLTYASLTAAAFVAQSKPIVYGHRASCFTAPEDTLPGYRSSVAAHRVLGKIPALELNVGMGADGSLLVTHDVSFGRIVNSTSRVGLQTAASFQNLTIPAGTLLGSAWGNLNPPLFSQVLDEFAGKAVLLIGIEVDSGQTAIQVWNAVITEIVARGIQSSVWMQAEDTTGVLCPLATAAGIAFNYYWTTNPITSPVTPAQAIAAGATMLSIATNYSDANIASVVAAAHGAGITAGMLYNGRRCDLLRAVTLGCDLFQSNDLAYTLATAAMFTTDPAGLGTPAPGRFVASGGATDPNNANGEYLISNLNGLPFSGTPSTTGYRQQYPATGSGGSTDTVIYEMAGYFGPAANSLPAAGNFKPKWAGTFVVEVVDSDTTRYVSIAAGVDDTAFTGAAIPGGYQALYRQNGTAALYKMVPGAYVATGSGGYTLGTAAGPLSSATWSNIMAPNTLGSGGALTQGTPVTQLTLGNAITLASGSQLLLANGQVATLNGAAVATTTPTINSLTPTSNVAANSAFLQQIPITLQVDSSSNPIVVQTAIPAGSPTGIVTSKACTIGAGQIVNLIPRIGSNVVATLTAGTYAAGATIPIASLSGTLANPIPVGTVIPTQSVLTFTRVDTAQSITYTDTSNTSVGPYAPAYPHYGKAATAASGAGNELVASVYARTVA